MADITKLLLSTKPKIGSIRFIAIDGRGGSGKSSLANLLAEKLDAEIIHTDDFASWDNPLNWWPSLIKSVFMPIAAGAKTLSYTRSKWWATHHPEPVVDQRVTTTIILEGMSSLRNEFREYISLGIFVDTPKEICLERGLARDTGTNKSREELTRIWQQWFIDEDKYFERDCPQAYADILVDGTRPFEEQIFYN